MMQQQTPQGADYSSIGYTIVSVVSDISNNKLSIVGCTSA